MTADATRYPDLNLKFFELAKFCNVLSQPLCILHMWMSPPYVNSCVCIFPQTAKTSDHKTIYDPQKQL